MTFSSTSFKYEKVDKPVGETDESIELVNLNENNSYGSVSAHNNSESENSKVQSFTSSAIIYFCVLTGESARGILFPTLWLNILSSGGNKFSQGFAVAAFSLGRVLTSPVFGTLSEVWGYRTVLIICNLVLICGAILYCLSSTVQSIIFSQFIIGCGAGSLGVTRSYIAEKTPLHMRTVSLAYLTAFQYGGFTCTPIIGAILASLGYHYKVLGGLLQIDENSLPALFLLALSSVSILLLAWLFADIDRTVTSGLSGLLEEESHKYTSQPPRHTPMLSLSSWLRKLCCIHEMTFDDKLVVAGCLLNVATKGTIGVFEALGSEFVITRFGWKSSQVGVFFSVFGAMGVLALLMFSSLVSCFSDIQLIVFGMCVMVVSCLVIAMQLYSQSELQFYLAIAMMYSIGYPIGHTALIGMFSKISKSGPQGAILGWFGAAGSLARILFPILAGFLAEYVNEYLIFLVMMFVLLIPIACVFWYRDYVPQFH